MDRNKNIFDKIGALIPGYVGYADRDSRRICDQKIRKELEIDLLYTEKNMTQHIQNEKLDDKIIKLDKIRKKINTMASKIKNAPYGESSFFSDNVIDKKELEKIYQFDLDLKHIIELVKNAVKNKKWISASEEISLLRDKIEERNQFIRRFS